MPKVNLYVPNVSLLKQLQKKTSLLWYNKYGNSLSLGELTIMALKTLEAELEGKGPNDNKRQALYKYGRTGIPHK